MKIHPMLSLYSLYFCFAVVFSFYPFLVSIPQTIRNDLRLLTPYGEQNFISRNVPIEQGFLRHV